MPIFSLKHAFSMPRGKSPGESFLRLMLLITVFVVAGYMYTRHFDRTIEMIEARQAVYDQTETLSRDQKQAFREYAVLLRDEFGLDLRLSFTTGPADYPELDSKTVYMAVDTVNHNVDIVLPPLVEAALGAEFARNLKTEHFPPYFEKGQWSKATALALTQLWERLMKIHKPSNDIQDGVDNDGE